jgi:hypothetical protein
LTFDDEGLASFSLVAELPQDLLRSWQSGSISIGLLGDIELNAHGLEADRTLVEPCGPEDSNTADGGTNYGPIPGIECKFDRRVFALDPGDFECDEKKCTGSFDFQLLRNPRALPLEIPWNAEGKAHGLWCGPQDSGGPSPAQVAMSLK